MDAGSKFGAAVPAAVPSAPAPGWSGPSKLKAKYGGKCTKCGSAVEAGEQILYADRRIVGCPACSPADLSDGPRALPTMFEGPTLIDSLIEQDVAPEAPVFPLPEPRSVLDAIPACPFPLDEHQQRVVNWRNGEAVVAAAAGCHRKGQRLLMFDGTIKAVEEVRIGDHLMGPDGYPRVVVKLIRGHGPMARIAPTKGDAWVVNLDHVLTVQRSSNARRKDHKQIVDITVREHLTRGPTWQKEAKLFRRPVAHFCQPRPPPRLPVDPYFLGMLLGDGSLVDHVGLSKPGTFVRDLVDEQARVWGLEVRVHRADTNPTYVLTAGRGKGKPRENINPLITELRGLGLFGLRGAMKFVPLAYKQASVAERAALIAGLMDSDGHLSNGSVDFVNVSKQLAHDFAFVCRSLGFAAYMKPTRKSDQNGTWGDYWRVSVSGDFTTLPLRRLKAQPRRQPKDVLCTSFKVEMLKDEEDFFGFTLTGDGRYLLEDFTVTHNSGKSTVLVERTTSLVREGVPPEAVLTLVYNRDAATSLRKKLAARMGNRTLAERIPAYTFHGWAFTQMMTWFPGQFTTRNIVGLEGAPKAVALARNVVKRLGWDEGVEPADMVKLSEMIREALIDFDAPNAVERILSELPIELDERLAAQGLAFARAYQTEKAGHGAIDFSDMLWMVCRVIARNGARARELQARYLYVQVDECQDTNPARMRISTWLGGAATVDDEAPRLLSVGDARQSVYAFTGARPALFRHRIDVGGTLLTLPINRRSLPSVVDAGNRIARGRDWNLGGDCTPSHTEAGEPVHVWPTRAEDEGHAIATEIKARMEGGLPLMEPETKKANYVLLTRTNAAAASLEIAMMVAGLPVRVLGSHGGAWATSPGRDFLAYLRGSEGQADEDLARIANKPNRYLKRALVEDAVAAHRDGADLFAALRNCRQTGGVRFAGELEGLSVLEWGKRCTRIAGLLVEDVKERAATSRRLTAPEDDLEETYAALAEAAIQLGSLEAIDMQIERMKKVKNTEPAVELCTMHRSKGLEWPVVFVTSVAEGVLPHAKCSDIEEERRLFYVAVTRAQQTCIVSTGGSPSSFVYDLDMTDTARGLLTVLKEELADEDA